MKNIIILLSILTISFSLMSCTVDPPDSVVSAFNKMFPNVQNLKWSKENATEYEAEFTVDGKSYSANFAKDGKWLETEMEISVSELPEIIVTNVNKTYKNCKINGAYQINNSKNEMFYELDITINSKKKEVVLNSDGNFVE